MDTLENKKLHLLAALVILGIIIFNLSQFYLGVEDDAYISFRYLDNWLQGHGLVFNAGEYVEGYTNYLWIMVLAPFRMAGLSVETTTYAISLALLTLLLLYVFQITFKLSKSSLIAWSAVLLLATSVTVIRWTSSGMETLFVTTILAYANWILVRDEQHNLHSSIAFGTAILIRPDALLFAIAAFGATLISTKYRKSNNGRSYYKPAIVILILPALHAIFRFIYYGEWLPNTFYAKLSGQSIGSVSSGVTYLEQYFLSGGMFLIVPVLFLLFFKKRWNWYKFALILQVLLFVLYVIKVGGDYLAFHRFLVPVIPLLCILAAISLQLIIQKTNLKSSAIIVCALLLAVAQNWYGLNSREYQAYLEIYNSGQERLLVANWLKNKYPAKTLIAVNAAGIIPFKTSMTTIDMLGLNDHHIARVTVVNPNEGKSFVGHYKYDGEYVCKRKPNVVVISGGTLQRGRSKEEVIAQAPTNTFASDRAFLSARDCIGQYKIVAAEILPGKYAVVYEKQTIKEVDSQPHINASAQTWFMRGVKLLGVARFKEAQEAFQVALNKDPENPIIISNLAYSYLDTKQYNQAITLFSHALKLQPRYYDALYGLALARENSGQVDQALILWKQYIDEAPNSPWMDRAKIHWRLLSGRNIN